MSAARPRKSETTRPPTTAAAASPPIGIARPLACFAIGSAFTALILFAAKPWHAEPSPAAIARTSTSSSRWATADPSRFVIGEYVMLSDAELDKVDPLLMNIAVLKGIPEYENLDTERYVRIVDDWAKRIGEGLAREERRASATDPLYSHDPDLWRAGGMAVAVAGSSIGISYTADPLDPADPAQSFLPGLIDTKKGTCATMPVLYLAIAHRLGWPLKAVVSCDHMWCRWDDGVKRFNLEATDVEMDGDEGSFASPSDGDYARELGTPKIALDTGSDFTSLTKRELLGVFLQARAGYWMAHDRWDLAEQDLCLARSCFPMNRDIFLFLAHAMMERAGHILTEEECDTTGRRWQTATRSARRRFVDLPDYPWDLIQPTAKE